jgi:type II secretory pathway pseudopilin PulG
VPDDGRIHFRHPQSGCCAAPEYPHRPRQPGSPIRKALPRTGARGSARMTGELLHAHHEKEHPMEDGIWVGRDGKQQGPYSEADVRRWLAEGRFGRDAVGWRKGMSDWAPLASLLREPVAAAPPPAPPPATPRPATFEGRAPRRDGWADTANAYGSDEQPTYASRRDLPPPPSMHWGLVILFTILTLGIFGIVWPFIQANWVRRIDGESNAKLMLGLSITCYFLGYFLIRAGTPSLEGDGAHPAMVGFGGLLELSYYVLYLAAFFSMASSIKQEMKAYRVPVQIGGVTLFFFNTLYLQGQLSWLARWQRTGQTSPRPSKGVFWLLLGIPLAVGIVAAVAIPSYQEYVLRAQVASALSQAEPIKAQIIEAVGRNRAWPESNAQAGLGEPAAYASANLAGFSVEATDEGTVLVAVFGERVPGALRGRRLALIAHGQDGAIVWTCVSPDIDDRFLPMQCRS